MEQLNDEGAYQPPLAYGQSKLSNILFALELAEREKENNVLVNAIHPGMERGRGEGEGKGKWEYFILVLESKNYFPDYFPFFFFFFFFFFSVGVVETELPRYFVDHLKKKIGSFAVLIEPALNFLSSSVFWFVILPFYTDI